MVREAPTDEEPAGSSVEPLAAPRDFEAVYSDIKRLITEGQLPSGAAVSQLELTRRLGVSRTPIREALRRLQAEGLLDGQRNQRMRVTAITPDELDAIYASRIFLESMAVELSVPRMNSDDLQRLKDASTAIDWSCVGSDPRTHDWQLANFKSIAMIYAGEGILRAVLEYFNRCERVRQLYQVSSANAAFALEEHNALLDAYMRGATEDAVFFASRHLGRTALSVIGFMAPDYEPRAIRHALSKAAPANAGTALLSLLGDGSMSRRPGAGTVPKGAKGI
jgi:DNA-binding GntR family transcriptional regulator